MPSIAPKLAVEANASDSNSDDERSCDQEAAHWNGIEFLCQEEDPDEEPCCVSIAPRPDEIARLVRPDEVVIPGEQRITVAFDYPLSNPVTAECEADRPEGFTRLHLLRFVQAMYVRIYEEEEQAAGDPGLVPGMMNRATSEGPYGIWGHDIDDLVLEGMYQEASGDWGLQVGS